MTIKRKRIVITTGGTGGHVIPALSLSESLKKNFDIEIFCDKRGLKFIRNPKNIKTIHAGTIFHKNIFKIIIDLYKIIFSFTSSFFYLKKNKPELVFGMGGYSSFPVCVASYLLKIPVIIYENNMVLGKANKVLLPLSKKILVSQENIYGIKKNYKDKIFFSGYLLRKEIFDICKEKENKIDNNELSILIMGGSQSARIFGEKIPEIVVSCYKQNIKLKIYQQCLSKQMDQIKKIYDKYKINFKLFSFSEKLSDYYQNADLAITRSGASSIAELINLRIPFVAIPLPSSTDGHQLKNAMNFKKKGYCILLEEKFISIKLFEILCDLNKNREKLLSFKSEMKKHSDKESILKVNKFIEKFLNEKH